jgi:hypothetical protein
VWEQGEVTLRADCGATQGPAGEYCTLTAQDNGLHDAERSIQRAFEEGQKLKNSPPAPKL